MSRRKGNHYSGHPYARWTSIKIMRHAQILDLIICLFQAARLIQKYYEKAPSADELSLALGTAWQGLKQKPGWVVAFSVETAQRNDNHLVVIKITASGRNQLCWKEKEYVVCGTPKGYLWRVNGC